MWFKCYECPENELFSFDFLHVHASDYHNTKYFAVDFTASMKKLGRIDIEL